MAYLLGVTFIGLVLGFFVWRFLSQRQLTSEGLVARGRVIQKRLISGKDSDAPTGILKYEFHTPQGEYVQKSVVVGEVVLIDCVEGDTIDVVYLKNNPRISDTKQSVDKSRAALNLPPLSASRYS